VVSVSKTYAASDSFVESGVDDFLRSADSKCDRTVVLPDPDSPLLKIRSSPVQAGPTRDQLIRDSQENYGLVF
jgi:hypothetical protein